MANRQGWIPRGWNGLSPETLKLECAAAHSSFYEKKRKIMRNVASVAELTKSFFAEIDKVENREGLKRLRVKYLGCEKGILTAVLRSLAQIREFPL
jgi:hypothetical protein